MATFGKTNIGGTTPVLFPGDNISTSVCQFSLLDNNASITKLTAYQFTKGTGTKWKGVIYSDSANLPLTLLGVTNEVLLGADANWVDLPFASPLLLNAGLYWIGVIGDAQITTASDVAGLNSIDAASNPYPATTSPFSQTSTSVSQNSIYATYTVSYSNTPIGRASGIIVARNPKVVSY